MVVSKTNNNSKPIISDGQTQFISVDKSDKFDLFHSRNLALVNLANIKNAISKVPKGCFFELEFIIDENTRNMLRTFRNTKTNEYMGSIIDELFPTDGSNTYLKILAYNVSGFSQSTDKKQFKVLNREWTLPKSADYGTISVDFYDMVYQYKDGDTLINKYFNISEFFKIWMDNMFILDERGKIISTRIRYLLDYVVPKIKIHQYFPVMGTREDGYKVNSVSYMAQETQGADTTKTEFEKRYNLFTTTWLDVVGDMEEIKSKELIYNTNFLRVIQGTFKYVFAYGAAALQLGTGVASYVSDIVSSAKGTNVDEDYNKEVMFLLSQNMMKFFGQQSSPDLGQAQIISRLDSDLTKVKDVNDFLNTLTNLVSDEEFQKMTEEVLKSPEVQRIVQESFDTVGVKYGVMKNDGFDFLTESESGISLIVKKLKENKLLENAGIDPTIAFKVKKLAESFDIYLRQLNSENMQDGIPKGTITSETYAQQKWENIKIYLKQAFYREQQNAYNNIYSPFNFDMDDDRLSVNEKGELVKEKRKDSFPHGKTGFSKTNEVVNTIKGGAAKGLQILSLALGLYVFTFALVDLAKLFTKENVIREMDRVHGLNMTWEKLILLSGNTAASLSPTLQFGYTKKFYEYLKMVSKPNASWWGSGNQIGQLIGNNKSSGDYINESEIFMTTETDSRFTGIKEFTVGTTKVFGVVPIKQFTYYNVWPTKISFGDMSFESTDDLSKINVEFAFTYFEEN